MTATRLTRKEKQQQTRESVLTAAAELFAANGVEGTSLEAIARQAGVTQGAIYSNFASKSDLWRALATERSRTLTFSAHIRGDESLREELAGLGRAVWELLRSTSRTELLLAQEFDLFLMRHPPERAKHVRGMRAARRQLAGLLRRGGLSEEEALQLARAIEAAIEGLLHIFMLDSRAVDEQLCVTLLSALADPS